MHAFYVDPVRQRRSHVSTLRRILAMPSNQSSGDRSFRYLRGCRLTVVYWSQVAAQQTQLCNNDVKFDNRKDEVYRCLYAQTIRGQPAYRMLNLIRALLWISGPTTGAISVHFSTALLYNKKRCRRLVPTWYAVVRVIVGVFHHKRETCNTDNGNPNSKLLFLYSTDMSVAAPVTRETVSK